MSRLHDLKVWPPAFRDLKSGAKPYEVRRADRDFRVGDLLLLREWRPEGTTEGLGALFDDGPGYTGEAVIGRVTHVTPGPLQFPGAPLLLPDGVVVLGVEVEDEVAVIQPTVLRCPNRPDCSDACRRGA